MCLEHAEWRMNVIFCWNFHRIAGRKVILSRPACNRFIGDRVKLQLA